MSSCEKEGARQVRIRCFSDVKAVWFVFSGCASSFGSRVGGWETRVSRNDGSRRVATKWVCGRVRLGFCLLDRFGCIEFSLMLCFVWPERVWALSLYVCISDLGLDPLFY